MIRLNRHTGQQSKGACLVPKRALRVMEGEANRILQLTANAVIPVSYIVPRKVLIFKYETILIGDVIWLVLS